DPPVDPGAPERLDERDQPALGELVDGARARLHGRDARGVVGVDPQQHLAAVETGGGDAAGVVAGEPVVELERRAGQPAAVHRAQHELVVERTEQRQLLDEVGGAEEAVHTGPRQRDGDALEEVRAVGHRARVVRDGERAARGVVGRDDQQLLARGCTGEARALAQPLGEQARPLAAHRGDVGAGGRRHAEAPASRSSTSAVVGIAVEHSRREATIAPAALANAIVRCRSQPLSRPWHSAPPKPSPAPRPLTTSTRLASTTTSSSAVRASTPRGPILTIASSTPASSSAAAARSGPGSPTAIAHSSRLPTATVTWPSTSRTAAFAVASSAHSVGR